VTVSNITTTADIALVASHKGSNSLLFFQCKVIREEKSAPIILQAKTVVDFKTSRDSIVLHSEIIG
jgi:hypothetical protein